MLFNKWKMTDSWPIDLFLFLLQVTLSPPQLPKIKECLAPYAIPMHRYVPDCRDLHKGCLFRDELPSQQLPLQRFGARPILSPIHLFDWTPVRALDGLYYFGPDQVLNSSKKSFIRIPVSAVSCRAPNPVRSGEKLLWFFLLLFIF